MISVFMGMFYPQRLAIPASRVEAAKPLPLEVVDRMLGAATLVASVPVIAASALAVSALSRRSPFIAIERVGQSGRSFWMLKLRTMWDSKANASGSGLCEYIREAWVPEEKGTSDPRVTSVFARFCRRFSIDELPQLWHVASGEMSMVGPRPLTAQEISKHYQRAAHEMLSARPGLTGLWQVRGRNSLSYRQRRKLDLHLVRNFSWRLYLFILWRTIPSVFAGRNAG